MLRFDKTDKRPPKASPIRSFRPLLWMAFGVIIMLVMLSQVAFGPMGDRVGNAGFDDPSTAEPGAVVDQDIRLRADREGVVAGRGAVERPQPADEDEWPDLMNPIAGQEAAEQPDLADDVVGPQKRWTETQLSRIRDHALSTPHSGLLFEMMGTLAPFTFEQLQRELQHMDRDYPVGYAQLYRQPAQYRGELLKIRGHALSAFPRTAPEGEHGVDRFYEVWVLAPDKQNLFWCNVVNLPEGFPVSQTNAEQLEDYTRISEPVEVIGYFFRVGVYSGQDGSQKAPVLAAGTLNWMPEEDLTFVDMFAMPDLRIYPYIIGGTLLLAILASVWIFLKSGRRAADEHEHRLAGVSVDGLASVVDLADTTSPEEGLKKLERTLPDEKPPWQTMAEGDPAADGDDA